MSPPTYHLVINKYKENMDWISHLKPSHVFLYNKSETPIAGGISRPNIGREGETFIYHILQHYHHLPDFLITLQGNPFDHLYNFVIPANLNPLIEGMIQGMTHQPIPTTIPLFTQYTTESLDEFPSLHMKNLLDMFHINDSACKYISGAQVIIPRSCIVNKPYRFYKILYAKLLAGGSDTYENAHYGQPESDSNSNSHFSNQQINPWQFERLLLYIFR